MMTLLPKQNRLKRPEQQQNLHRKSAGDSGEQMWYRCIQKHFRQLTEARGSCDSSAGYAQAAELSRKAAAESEQNINAQVTGFETEVSESVTQATEQITTARQKAGTDDHEPAGYFRAGGERYETAAYISEKNTEAKKEITDHAEQEIVRINAQDSVQQVQKNKEDVALLKKDLTRLEEAINYVKATDMLGSISGFRYSKNVTKSTMDE